MAGFQLVKLVILNVLAALVLAGFGQPAYSGNSADDSVPGAAANRAGKATEQRIDRADCSDKTHSGAKLRERNGYEDEPYTGQKSIICSGTILRIPEFTVPSYTDLYLGIGAGSCTEDGYEVTLGIGRECNNANVCYLGFFSRQKVNNIMNSALRDAFSQSFETIKLNSNIVAYILPVQVYAYTTPMRLIWFHHGYMNVVGNKGSSTDELIDMANSMIKSE